MGFRLTGFSTPFIGANWEYTDKKERAKPLAIHPGQKIRVFISSICGDKGKYDRVRAELKTLLEETKLVDVYLFEQEEASTLTAEQHYLWSLEDSDVCIFLIDNKDGVTEGVQREINTAKRCNIKSIFYFCDEATKGQTTLEKSLMGAKFAKSKSIHRFDDLSQDGAQALIDDIVRIYIQYCRGRLTAKAADPDEQLNTVDLPRIANNHPLMIPKTVISNVEKCKEYILKKTLDFSSKKNLDKIDNPSEIDEWGVQFLSILFDGNSIRSFNLSMYLECLKGQQDELYFKVVSMRWQAVQAFFAGNVAKCIEHLQAALTLAKENNQLSWVINDILIDIRNQHWVLNTINNCFAESSAQKELDMREEDVYYPVLDRIHDSLQEKYLDGLYKQKTASPYAITMGNSYEQYGELLASAFIVAIYNGSLTHILRFYNRVRDFAFYLCCKYDDWSFRKELLKYAIFAGEEKEIEGIIRSYPEVLNDMNATDAIEIMDFCNNHPIPYQRFSSQLLAFGTVGYYLNDSDYSKYEAQLIDGIKEWLNNENSTMAVASKIFKCLTGIAYRVSQNVLAEICCMFMEKHYSRWYIELFKLIAQCVNLKKMDDTSARSLIQCIIRVIEDDNEREQINYAPIFLVILRKQNNELTNQLDTAIKKYLPRFYNNSYRLETTTNSKSDYPLFIQEYIRKIDSSNKSQGKNGRYFMHSTRDIDIARLLLLEEGHNFTNDIMDSLISVVSDTLLASKESVEIKLDAISLLISIVIKCPEDYKRNKDVFEQIVENQTDILDIDNTFLSSNIDKTSLQIALSLLTTSMGGDGYLSFIEGIAYIQNDTATSIYVTRTIIKYFNTDKTTVLPHRIETIVLQNVLQWLCFNNIDIKCNATRILFMLIRNPDNKIFVNQKIMNLIDTESLYIKNFIMRQLLEVDNITDDTLEYVLSKCQQDPCYVVRQVCEEVREKFEKKKARPTHKSHDSDVPKSTVSAQE